MNAFIIRPPLWFYQYVYSKRSLSNIKHYSLPNVYCLPCKPYMYVCVFVFVMHATIRRGIIVSITVVCLTSIFFSTWLLQHYAQLSYLNSYNSRKRATKCYREIASHISLLSRSIFSGKWLKQHQQRTQLDEFSKSKLYETLFYPNCC